ncbi:MAG: YbaK/EbsC family protein [SAR324 cluster bacterium]|nr:YbaK/EbsC family protein [SAR324 cluster bacterium]
MPLKKLKEFLDSSDIKYVNITHSKAYTSQEIAASAHISGKELAKTIVVKLDGKFALAVLPASSQIDFRIFREVADADEVLLADEDEFGELFPECEVGAMPPFGNLYGLDVFVSEELAEDEEIAFNAGSHTELVRLAYEDFERLVEPTVADFTD